MACEIAAFGRDMRIVWQWHCGGRLWCDDVGRVKIEDHSLSMQTEAVCALGRRSYWRNRLGKCQ